MTDTPSTISTIAVAMLTVADQDAAARFYCDKLGFEVRADVTYGEDGAQRWLEVAPPGSSARVALNPPMGAEPGGGSIGVETPDAKAEHARLRALGDVDVDEQLLSVPGAPTMFGVRDPDGNHVWVVEAEPQG